MTEQSAHPSDRCDSCRFSRNFKGPPTPENPSSSENLRCHRDGPPFKPVQAYDWCRHWDGGNTQDKEAKAAYMIAVGEAHQALMETISEQGAGIIVPLEDTQEIDEEIDELTVVRTEDGNASQNSQTAE